MAEAPGRWDTPFRINLEQQKKRAKELLKAIEAGDADALARLQQVHPHPPQEPKLADAQLIIARELGVESWPRLKNHIAEMQAAEALMAGEPADTADTLHIRCGSDIQEGLKAAGFVGEFFEYANPFCQGPVVKGDQFLIMRAWFIQSGYGDELSYERQNILERLQEEEARLQAASGRSHVVIWKEHDSYDQLILARLLAAFHENGLPETLEIVSIDTFPGGDHFRGLGQLPPEAFRLLWDQRKPVTQNMLKTGAEIWDAIRDEDPSRLLVLANGPLSGLPYMGRALKRHCQELPWTTDGLSLTQRLVLAEAGKDGMTVGRSFRNVMLDSEPLPFLGDLMYWHIVKDMAAAEEPPIAIGRGKEWPRQPLLITPAGEALLAGERDFKSLAPPERWVGGVALRTWDQRWWRWNPDTQSVVKQ